MSASTAFADPDRRKLALSLGTNFLTRTPGLLLMLVVLPLFYRGLGPAAYAAMFAALAFGGLGVFLLGGAAVLGIREIGAAAGEGRTQDEADAFVSLVATNAGLAAGLMLVTAAAQWWWNADAVLICVALLPLVQAVLTTTVDNCRLAHNEHYWAASLSFGFQLLCYAVVLSVPAFSRNMLLAATIFHAPIALASMANAILLLRARPYLLRGRATRVRAMLRAAIAFGAADGALTASLALALIGFQTWAAAETAAWFATQFRLFQMWLNPVMTLMVPLASYLRLTWSRVSRENQRQLARLAFGAGASSCLALGGGLGVGGPLYARLMLHLPPPAPLWSLAPVFLFLGTIGFYRAYASVANLVLDGERLALGVVRAILVPGAVALAALGLLAPVPAFGLFAALSSFMMLVELTHAQRRVVAPRRAHAERIEILGTPVSLTDPHRAVEQVLALVAARRGAFVCVRDVHGIMLARRDPAFRDIHREAALVLPDGMPLVHVARLRGHREVARVAGPDFLELLAGQGRASGLRHYFHGGRPGVAECMAANLVRRYPGMVVAGVSAPPFGEQEGAALEAELQRIRDAAPDVVWVGLGSPKQERWMHLHRHALPGMTLIGVGAAFDFHAGTRRRAPRWMQRATLEWLHRLLSEPRRLWKRYLLLAPSFVWHLLWERQP